MSFKIMHSPLNPKSFLKCLGLCWVLAFPAYVLAQSIEYGTDYGVLTLNNDGKISVEPYQFYSFDWKYQSFGLRQDSNQNKLRYIGSRNFINSYWNADFFNIMAKKSVALLENETKHVPFLFVLPLRIDTHQYAFFSYSGPTIYDPEAKIKNQFKSLVVQIYNSQSGEIKYQSQGKVIHRGSYDHSSLRYSMNAIQKPNENFAWWLVCNNYDSICVFSIDADSQYLHSVYRKPNSDAYMDSYDNTIPIIRTSPDIIHNRNFTFDHKGKQLLYSINHAFTENINDTLILIRNKGYVHLFDFDSYKGELSFKRELDKINQSDSITVIPPYNKKDIKGELFEEWYHRPVFTLDDKYVVFTKTNILKKIHKCQSLLFKNIYRHQISNEKTDTISLIDFLRVKIGRVETSFFFHDLKVLHDSNLYIIVGNQSNILLVKVSNLNKEKLSLSDNFSYVDIESPVENFVGREFAWEIFEKYYPKISFHASCANDTLRINNLSHPYFTQFEWQIKHRGKTIAFDNKSHHLDFVPPFGGTFNLSFTASRPNGQIKKIDTLLHIPKFPNAHIHIDSTIACAYNNIKFFDSTSSDTSIAAGATWQWSFFHEDTLVATAQNKNPAINFSQPGHYAVSLVHDNGFCSDSTFLQDSLFVLPAPKPGFQLLKDQNCSPATITFIDSSHGAITASNSQWNDGFEDTSSIYSRTINKSGFYTIIQMLSGPSGCISRDTAKFYISQGFSPKTDLYLSNATVLDEQLVKINWSALGSGSGYQIFREDSSFSSTIRLDNPSLDSLIDTVASTDNYSYAYRIQAVDSCNQNSVLSNLATTILLQY